MSLIPWRRKRETAGEHGESERSLAPSRREVDSLFEDFLRDLLGVSGWAAPLAGLATPRMDLSDTDRELTVTLELPGVQPENVNIHVVGSVLTVRGEKKEEREEKTRSYHCQERCFGSFQRTVQLPGTADPQKVNAEFKNGVLTITIGKHPTAKPQRIKVHHA